MSKHTMMVGRTAEKIVKDLLTEAGFDVYEYGYEYTLPKVCARNPKIIGKAADYIRHQPDFVVVNKRGEAFFVEVKYRKNAEIELEHIFNYPNCYIFFLTKEYILAQSTRYLHKHKGSFRYITDMPPFANIPVPLIKKYVDRIRRQLGEDSYSGQWLGKVTEPLGIFYNKKFNLVIIHSVVAAQGIEWRAADVVLDVAKQLKAKEIISVEGVGSSMPSETSNVFYYTNEKGKKKGLEQIGLKPLNEGIIMGVTSAMMLKVKLPFTCILAETHSALPDSKAAAKIIEYLDKMVGLKLDPAPLVEQAEKFESKLKGMMTKNQEAQDLQERKQMSYVG